MTVTRDVTYFLDKLGEQIRFLLRSCEAFDNGDDAEAVRIAAILRVLLHDKGRSTSLLTHIGKKEIQFLDTNSGFNPKNLFPTFEGLTIMKAFQQNGPTHVAPLKITPPYRMNKWTTFEKWWNDIVYVDKKKSQFTRKDLILTLSDKEGGAHVDRDIDQKAHDFMQPHPMELGGDGPDGIFKPFQNSPALPSIRQIAFEVLHTLKKEMPELDIPAL